MVFDVKRFFIDGNDGKSVVLVQVHEKEENNDTGNFDEYFAGDPFNYYLISSMLPARAHSPFVKVKPLTEYYIYRVRLINIFASTTNSNPLLSYD